MDEDFKDKNKEDWRKINGWATPGTGLSVDMAYMDFSKDFIERALATVGESIDDLITRAHDALK